ncbi:hypothetical protein JVU11DRAFT_11296 [Chiua virens]|nr:hypothetical protein JVU11DRAFT_11296 [Chiua virens]
MSLPKVRRALELIVKPKPSFEVPASSPDPLYKFPHEYSFYAALAGTPGHTPFSPASPCTGRGTRPAGTKPDTLSPETCSDFSRPPVHSSGRSPASSTRGRYLQVPSPLSIRDSDRSSRPGILSLTPGPLGRVTEEVSEYAEFLNGPDTLSAVSDVDGTPTPSVDSLDNKPVSSPAYINSPESEDTVYFDALDTLNLSPSCAIMDAHAEVAGNGPLEPITSLLPSQAQRRKDGKDRASTSSRFDVPQFVIEGTSPGKDKRDRKCNHATARSSPAYSAPLERIQSSSGPDRNGDRSPLCRPRFGRFYEQRRRGQPIPLEGRKRDKVSDRDGAGCSDSHDYALDGKLPRGAPSSLVGSGHVSHVHADMVEEGGMVDDPPVVSRQGQPSRQITSEMEVQGSSGRCRRVWHKVGQGMYNKLCSWRDRVVGAGCQRVRGLDSRSECGPCLGSSVGSRSRTSAPLVGATGADPVGTDTTRPEMRVRPTSASAWMMGANSTSTERQKSRLVKRRPKSVGTVITGELDVTRLYAPQVEPKGWY